MKLDKHRKILDKIVAHSGQMGLEGVVSVSIEPYLYRDGKLIARPDVVVEVKGKQIHIIEYKCNGNGKKPRIARAQLERAKGWYARNRRDISREDIHTYLISGDDPKYRDLLR